MTILARRRRENFGCIEPITKGNAYFSPPQARKFWVYRAFKFEILGLRGCFCKGRHDMLRFVQNLSKFENICPNLESHLLVMSPLRIQPDHRSSLPRALARQGAILKCSCRLIDTFRLHEDLSVKT